MKKKIILIPIVTVLSYLALTGYTTGPAAGGAGNHTGSAGSSANCSGSGCHSTNSTTTTGIISVLNGATPVTSYVPGTQYTVTITANNSSTSLTRFGFQASCVKASATSTYVGTLSAGTSTNVHVYPATNPTLVEHSTPIAAVSAGNYTATFKWTAPAAGTGTVSFYSTVNVVNFNGSESGDFPNAVPVLSLTETPTAVGNIANDFQISLFPNPAKESITLKASNVVSGNYAINIYSAAGAKVAAQNATIANQKTIVSVDISNLANGTYYLQLTDNSVSQVKTFVKE